MSGSTPSHPPLSLQQQILMTTDGTVTDLVALFSGEAIHVTKLEQQEITGLGPPELALTSPSSLLRRVILLSGERKHYIHAESFFVLRQMPPSLQRALLETETPIGLLWKEARLETFREVVTQEVQDCPGLLSFFADVQESSFLSRTYLVHHQRQPFGMITEKFPLSYFR